MIDTSTVIQGETSKEKSLLFDGNFNIFLNILSQILIYKLRQYFFSLFHKNIHTHMQPTWTNEYIMQSYVQMNKTLIMNEKTFSIHTRIFMFKKNIMKLRKQCKLKRLQKTTLCIKEFMDKRRFMFASRRIIHHHETPYFLTPSKDSVLKM